jgi:hypothetical protein
MPIKRSSVVGTTSGIVVLGGVVAFTVGLPHLTGDEAAASSTHDDRPAVADVLPESLLGNRLVRIAKVNQQVGDEIEKYGATTLSDVFGADTAVARYVSPDGQVQFSITVSDAGGGLFLQNGPPSPRQITQSQGFVVRTRQVDGVPCSELFAAQPAASGGKAPDPTKSAPVQVQCQTEVDGRAFNGYGVGGISAEQAVQALDESIALDES